MNTRNPQPARVRLAPSPTGRTHLGNGRTALYNYLLARQSGGQFILRIEDTDQKRYQPDAELELIESLRSLGLDWDEGPDVGGPHAPYHQSQRKDIYQGYAQQLIADGHAYYCFCSPARIADLRREQQQNKTPFLYDGLCRALAPADAARRIAAGETFVVRFRTPKEGSITSIDLLRGEITVENRLLDDTILVKSDGLAVYHLAAMVDDHLMEITHVLRGAEWLPTFPLHTHIYHAFGWEQPVWVHLSLFLKPSGKGKMSKREATGLLNDGYSIFIKDLLDLGYLPEAIINWVALMGWSYDDHTEFFTTADLVEKFSLNRLNPSPAAINFSKLDHFNGLHIRSLTVPDLAARIKPYLLDAGYTVADETLLHIAPIIQERLVTLDDAVEKAGFFFEDDVSPQPDELVGKKMTPQESGFAASRAHDILLDLPVLTHDTAEAPLRTLADDLGLKAGQLFGILRVAVTGQKVSPPLLESMEILGKDLVLQRLQNAISLLDTYPPSEG